MLAITKYCVHIMTQGTNWYTALPADPSSVSEGMPINKLNMHGIKGKGWRETLPRSLMTLWKLRERGMAVTKARVCLAAAALALLVGADAMGHAGA